jgi:hypothetical protein
MFNLGAFAGGLAQGIHSGQDMKIRQNTAERLAKADDRVAEIHHERLDKADFSKDKRDRLRAANEEIAAGWGESGQDQSKASIIPSKAGLSTTVPPEQRSLANQAAPGLMSQYGKPLLPKSPAMQEMTANEAIGRRILTGDLLEDTDELTRMANIYKKHGLLAEMLPWMNKAYAAKKKRIPDALHSLLNGDAKGAREALRSGGINLAEDPMPTEQSDPSGNWRLRFQGGGEKDVNLKDLATQFFPEHYLNARKD